MTHELRLDATSKQVREFYEWYNEKQSYPDLIQGLIQLVVWYVDMKEEGEKESE